MANDDLSSFARRIRLTAAKVQPGSDQAVRTCAIAVATEVVSSTPADTSRAINNWNASLGASSPRFVQAKVPGVKGSTKAAAVAAALSRMIRKIKQYKTGDPPINLTNAAPYIEQLNAGSSKQAPAGFIEAGIQRGRAVIRNVRILK
jgi:hypothetical protein